MGGMEEVGRRVKREGIEIYIYKQIADSLCNTTL